MPDIEFNVTNRVEPDTSSVRITAVAKLPVLRHNGTTRGALRTLWIAALGAAVLLLAATQSSFAAPAAALYDVSLTRIAQDVYRDSSSRLVVLTRYCYEYAYGDDAVYNESSKRLIFSSSNTCDVAGIYRSNANLRRVDQDIYQDTGGQGYLRTRYCYVYTYGEDVLIVDGSVIFLDSRDRCNTVG